MNNPDDLNQLPYCLNCRDELSQQIGCFAFDPDLYRLGQGVYAIGPVFATVDEFYDWASSKGFIYYSELECFVLCRHKGCRGM